jgi:putative SOS response-associated peptidase YedK
LSGDNTAMCVNYRPATPAQLQNFFKVSSYAQADDPDSSSIGFQYPEESFPGYAAPMIVADQVIKACFGLIPFWAKDSKLARSTYNARSETVAEKPSFRQAWRRSQFCLVPMQAFYEPNYESGSAIRWRIGRGDQQPFAVAGLWDRWLAPNKEVVHSFTMLTLNADQHGLMKRFHKPGEEKRTIAILDQGDWRAWTEAKPGEAMAMLRGPDPGIFSCEPAPIKAKNQTKI